MGTLDLRVAFRSHCCDVGSIGLASRRPTLAGIVFNRWADAELDAKNLWTSMRAIPTGQLSKGFVGGFTVVTALLFLIARLTTHRLTLLLAPAELGLVLFYSDTKRFTR